MSDTSPPPPPPPPPPTAVVTSNTPDPIQYWCYQCDKRVPVETVPDNPNNIICFECKNGFVESILVTDEDTTAFGNEFIQVLRLIAEAAREDDEPPPPPPTDHHAGDNDNDYLRIELDGWDGGEYVVTDDEEQEFRDRVRSRWYFDDMNDDDNQPEDQIENRNDEQIEIENQNDEQIENQIEEDEHDGDVRRERRDVLRTETRIEADEHDDDDVRGERRDVRRFENRNEDDDDDVRRERRDILRLRLRQVASRAASRHSRILDWAEMLMGLENQSIEFRLQVNGNSNGNDDDDDDDAYVGNPGDYVDAAGYETLLETLAESDVSGRRGAPPAAKSAVENLHTVEVDSHTVEICAVCKETVLNNEGKVVNQLECGHMYHGECIVTWLSYRNTCPVCRFELPTDDPEYEEDRKRRLMLIAAANDHGGCTSSSGAGE